MISVSSVNSVDRDSARASRRLPAPPLGRRVLIAAGLGSLALAGLAVALHSWFDTIPTQPLVAQAVFTAMMAVALLTMRDQHPFPDFGAANWVTLMRAVLVALAASLITEPAKSSLAWVVVALTATVAALDGIDGWLARRTGMSSAFGARFDMETDTFCMLVLSLVVWRPSEGRRLGDRHRADALRLRSGGMGVALAGAAAPLDTTRQGGRRRPVRRSWSGAATGCARAGEPGGPSRGARGVGMVVRKRRVVSVQTKSTARRPCSVAI